MQKVEQIVGILSNEWDENNTGGIRPKIGMIYDYKLIDIKLNDWILCYTTGEDNEAVSLGAKEWMVTGRVTIDWRTSSRERHKLIKNEIYRILRNAAKGDSYGLMYLIRGETDLSDRSKGLYRGTIEVEIYRIEKV